jgi:hypothetical protein
MGSICIGPFACGLVQVISWLEISWFINFSSLITDLLLKYGFICVEEFYNLTLDLKLAGSTSVADLLACIVTLASYCTSIAKPVGLNFNP